MLECQGRQGTPGSEASGNITGPGVEPFSGFNDSGRFILREGLIYYNKEVRKNNFDIFRYNLENSTTEKVVSRPECLRVADVSERYIAFTANTYYGSNVGVYNLETGKQRLLVDDEWERDYRLNQTVPSVWGNKVVYAEEKLNNTYIEIRNLGTGEKRKIDTELENIGPLEVYRDTVIWRETSFKNNSTSSRTYIYNLSNREKKVIANGSVVARPFSVSDGFMVWGERGDGENLYLYDLKEGEREGAMGLDLPSDSRILDYQLWNNSIIVAFRTGENTWIKRKNLETDRTEKVKIGENIFVRNLELYRNMTIIQTENNVS